MTPPVRVWIEIRCHLCHDGICGRYAAGFIPAEALEADAHRHGALRIRHSWICQACRVRVQRMHGG